PSAAPDPDPPAASLFDRPSLLNRVGGNVPLADKLIQHFLADTPSQLAILRKHLDCQDAPAARLQAHKLKGAAATLSVPHLRDLAHQAEQAAQAGELLLLAKLVAAIEGSFDSVRSALQASPVE